jgi:hypothetical protein
MHPSHPCYVIRICFSYQAGKRVWFSWQHLCCVETDTGIADESDVRVARNVCCCLLDHSVRMRGWSSEFDRPQQVGGHKHGHSCSNYCSPRRRVSSMAEHGSVHVHVHLRLSCAPTASRHYCFAMSQWLLRTSLSRCIHAT